MSGADWNLQTLLDMDGQRGEIGGGYWYKIEARRVDVSPSVPHGVKYSLTLHEPMGLRVLGIDNAHRPNLTGAEGKSASRRRVEYDHEHTGRRIIAYEYMSASDLIEDFFDKAETYLKKRGIEP